MQTQQDQTDNHIFQRVRTQNDVGQFPKGRTNSTIDEIAIHQHVLLHCSPGRIDHLTCVGSAQPDCLRVYRTADARRVRRETVLNKAKRSLRGTSGDRDLILRLDVKSFFGFGIGGQR